LRRQLIAAEFFEDFSRPATRFDRTMRRMKRMWWRLAAESKALALWFLSGIPTGLGVWIRARLMSNFFHKVGKDTVLQSGLRVTNPEKVSIGSHCNFAQGVFITGGGGVTVGDWVGFGPDVKVWSVTHRYEDADRPWLLQGWEKKAVVIEDDVWLGANAFVMPGVIIGKGAIISAGAVVNKSIPAYALVAGNPARVVGWRKRPDMPAEGEVAIPAAAGQAQ
jgi:acetyltransferase-like isoleucine patch superfamily enzyme